MAQWFQVNRLNKLIGVEPDEDTILIKIMNSLIKYHIIVTIPLLLIFGFYSFQQMSLELFMTAILIYSFAFRPAIDYYKLKRKELVEEEDFWKCFNPFFRFKFYKELMFEA